VNQAQLSLASIPTARGSESNLAALRHEVEKAVRGKSEAVELALIAIVARGHVLLEDVPGVGKSTLAKALAQGLGGSFSRISFTSDMLPADLTGVSIWSTRNERFEFRQGPIFANVVLADEINRAPPRTQSALLEAMGEGRVSIDGQTHALPSPFIVLATQNPEDHAGTYPLPESQRDRFMIRLAMGYVSPEVEIELIEDPQRRHAPNLHAVLAQGDLAALQAKAEGIFVHRDIAMYAHQVVHATRNDARIRVGVSLRGALAWIAAARARALMNQRTHVSCDDLQELAGPVLAHRLLLRAGGTQAEFAALQAIREIVASVAVPL
jgi:MoxR-like ATPase